MAVNTYLNNMATVFSRVFALILPCVQLSDISFFLDIDDCQPMPCKNNATCVDHVNNYTCTCDSGFTGRNCEIGELS